MNEELLKDLWEAFELEEIGTLDKFIKDMSNKDAAIEFYNAFDLNEIADEKKFLSDLGFSSQPSSNAPTKTTSNPVGTYPGSPKLTTPGIGTFPNMADRELKIREEEEQEKVQAKKDGNKIAPSIDTKAIDDRPDSLGGHLQNRRALHESNTKEKAQAAEVLQDNPFTTTDGINKYLTESRIDVTDIPRAEVDWEKETVIEAPFNFETPPPKQVQDYRVARESLSKKVGAARNLIALDKGEDYFRVYDETVSSYTTLAERAQEIEDEVSKKLGQNAPSPISSELRKSLEDSRASFNEVKGEGDVIVEEMNAVNQRMTSLGQQYTAGDIEYSDYEEQFNSLRDVMGNLELQRNSINARLEQISTIETSIVDEINASIEQHNLKQSVTKEDPAVKEYYNIIGQLKDLGKVISTYENNPDFKEYINDSRALQELQKNENKLDPTSHKSKLHNDIKQSFTDAVSKNRNPRSTLNKLLANSASTTVSSIFGAPLGKTFAAIISGDEYTNVIANKAIQWQVGVLGQAIGLTQLALQALPIIKTDEAVLGLEYGAKNWVNTQTSKLEAGIPTKYQTGFTFSTISGKGLGFLEEGVNIVVDDNGNFAGLRDKDDYAVNQVLLPSQASAVSNHIKKNKDEVERNYRLFNGVADNISTALDMAVLMFTGPGAGKVLTKIPGISKTVAPSIAVATVSAAQQLSQNISQYLDHGLAPDDAVWKALGKTAATASLEAAIGPLEAKLITKGNLPIAYTKVKDTILQDLALGKIGAKDATSVLWKTGITYFSDLKGEVIEEFSAEYLSKLIDSVAINEDFEAMSTTDSVNLLFGTVLIAGGFGLANLNQSKAKHRADVIGSALYNAAIDLDSFKKTASYILDSDLVRRYQDPAQRPFLRKQEVNDAEKLLSNIKHYQDVVLPYISAELNLYPELDEEKGAAVAALINQRLAFETAKKHEASKEVSNNKVIKNYEENIKEVESQLEDIVKGEVKVEVSSRLSKEDFIVEEGADDNGIITYKVGAKPDREYKVGEEVDFGSVGKIRIKSLETDEDGNATIRYERIDSGKEAPIKTKTFIGRDIKEGMKIFSDFDNTLYDPKTGQLTAVGKELREKLDSGELTAEDVEILTARDAEQAGVIGELFPELTIKSGLSPEAKAAEVAKAEGNSIFIDDNKENLSAAAGKGEVINSATVVPQKPVEVRQEEAAAQEEAGATETTPEVESETELVETNVQASETTEAASTTTPTEKVAPEAYEQASEPSNTVTTTLPGGSTEKAYIKEGDKWFAAKKDGTASKVEVKKPEFVTYLDGIQEQAASTKREQGVERVKVYKGKGRNLGKGENEGFNWVAEDSSVAENYAESKNSVEELTIPKPQNPLEFPFNSNVEVRAEDVGNILRAKLEEQFNEGNINDSQLDELFNLIDKYEEAAGKNLEKYHTKINKPKASGILSDIVSKLGYDSVLIKETNKSGELTPTYGIIKSPAQNVGTPQNLPSDSAPTTEALVTQEAVVTTQAQPTTIEVKDIILDNSTNTGKLPKRTYTKVGNNWQYTEGGNTKTVRSKKVAEQLDKLATTESKKQEPASAVKPKAKVKTKAQEAVGNTEVTPDTKSKIEAALAKLNALKGDKPTGPRMSLFGIDAIVTEIGIPLWNKAIDFAVGQIKKGTSFGKAVAATVDFIDSSLKGKKWDKQGFKNSFDNYLADSDNVKFQVLGEKGAAALDAAQEATTRLDNLKVAKEMEAAGKDTKAIRLVTGWEKGGDVKWKYEILPSKLKNNIDFINAKKFKLSDLLDNDELFKAFPELSDSEVVITPVSDFAGFVSNGIIYINENLIEDGKQDDLRRTLTHEAQHKIQSSEGFAKGGGEGKYRQGVRDAIKSFRESNKRINFGDRVPKEVQQAVEQALENQKLSGYVKLAADNIDVENDVVDAVSFFIYKNLAGEVEARNVEARMGMTPEQRRQTLLQETEDVAREDQIVIFNAFNNLDASFNSKPGTKKEIETLLEPIGKTTKEREEQIYKFFALPSMGGDKVKARELAKITNKLWENVAFELAKRNMQAANDWIQSRVVMMGRTSTSGQGVTSNIKNYFNKLREDHKELYSKFPDFDFVVSRIFDNNSQPLNEKFQEVKEFTDSEFYNESTKALFGGKELSQLNKEQIWAANYIKKNNINPKKFKSEADLTFFIESEINKLEKEVNEGTAHVMQKFTSEDAQALADSYGETGNADRAMMLDAVINEGTRDEVLKQTQDRQKESFNTQLNHFREDGLPIGAQLLLLDSILKNDYRVVSEIEIGGRKGKLDSYKKYLQSEGKSEQEIEDIVEKAKRDGLVTNKYETYKRKPNTINAFHEFDFGVVLDALESPKTTNLVGLVNSISANKVVDDSYIGNSSKYKVKGLSDGATLYKIPKGDLNAAEIVMAYSEATKEVMSGMPWCTSGKGKAESVISNGDVYYVLDKDGQPIIQVTYNNDGSLEQLGGVGDSQSIRLKDNKYIYEIVNEVPNIEGEMDRVRRDKLLFNLSKNDYNITEGVSKEDVKWLIEKAPKGAKYQNKTKDFKNFEDNITKELLSYAYDVPVERIAKLSSGLDLDGPEDLKNAEILIVTNGIGFSDYSFLEEINASLIIGDVDFRVWNGSAPKLTTIGGYADFTSWNGSAPELTTIIGSAYFTGWNGSAPELTTIGGDANFTGWSGSAPKLTTIGGYADFTSWNGSAPELTTIGGDAYFRGWNGIAPKLTTIGGNAYFRGWSGSAPKLTTIGGSAYFTGWSGSAPKLTTIGGYADFTSWNGSAPELTTIIGSAYFTGWSGSAPKLTTIGGYADFTSWNGSAPELTTIGGDAYFRGWNGIAPKLTTIGGNANFTGWSGSAPKLTSVGKQPYVRFQSQQTPTTVEAATNAANNLITELDRMITEGSDKKAIKDRVLTLAQAAQKVRDFKAVKAELQKNMKDPKWQVDAYHGTPYQFDKFTTDKIGTGYGDQALGWGLYFNSIKDISENYGKTIYKVTLHKGKTPDQYTWLEWDKPIPNKLIDLYKNRLGDDLRNFNGEGSPATGKQYYRKFAKDPESQKEVSLFLLENGIDGVKSPNRDGFTYVVFDENAITIEERIQFQQEAAQFRAAAIEVAKNQVIIAALDAPNASSFVHEMAHSFEPDLKADERQTFIDEYNEKFGDKVKGWNTDVSEYFARLWEKYLSNGRQLSEADVKDGAKRGIIQEIFDKFTDYLQGIYNGVLEYTNTKGVKMEVTISPQVQDIFDNIMGANNLSNVGLETKTDTTGETETVASKDVGTTKKVSSPAPPKTIAEANSNLKEAAKKAKEIWVTGNKSLGIAWDPKRAAVDMYDSSRDLLNALVDVIKLNLAKGSYDIKTFIDFTKNSFDLEITKEGAEYLFDEAQDPGMNREQVKAVVALRGEIDELLDKFDANMADIEYFQTKVREIYDKLRQKEKAGNKHYYFTTAELDTLERKSNNIRTQEDLVEFSDFFENKIESKELQKAKKKIEGFVKRAKKKFKEYKLPLDNILTKSLFKDAINFNYKDRSIHANNPVTNKLSKAKKAEKITELYNKDVARFKNFVEKINNDTTPSDSSFLEDIKYFGEMAREQGKKASAKAAVKNAEFDANGNLIEDGQVIIPFAKLPKEYKEEFDKRGMLFDTNGNLIDSNGIILKSNKNLSPLEKEGLTKFQIKNKKEEKLNKKMDADKETRQELLDDIDKIHKGSRPIFIDQALQVIADKFFDLTLEQLSKIPTSKLHRLVSDYFTLVNTQQIKDSFEASMSEINADKVGAEVVEVLQDRSGKFRTLLRDSFSGKNSVELLRRMISKVPLRRLDAVSKGKDGEALFDKLLLNLARGFGAFTSFNNKLKKDLRRLTKDIDTNSQIRLMLYAIDRQHKANFKENPEIKSLKKEMEDAKNHSTKDTNYKEGFYKVAEAIYEQEKAKHGGEFDYTKMELTPQEKKLFEYTDNLFTENQGKVRVTGARTKKDVKLYNFYTPLDRMKSLDIGKQVGDFAENVMNGGDMALRSMSVPGNVNTRINNDLAIRNWNFVTAAYESAKETELDYRVRQDLKEFGLNTKSVLGKLQGLILDINEKIDAETDANAKLELEKEKEYLINNQDFIQATQAVVLDVAKDNLMEQFERLDATDQVGKFLADIGYGAILASAPRAASEFVSNLAFAMTAYPKDFINGLKYLNSNDLFDQMLNLVSSTQSSRLLSAQGSLYQDRADVRGVDQGNPGVRTVAKVAAKALEVGAYKINSFNNLLNSQGDRLIARPLWIGSFSREYDKLKKEEIKGRLDRANFATQSEFNKEVNRLAKLEKFDINKYNEDSDFRFQERNIIDKAAKKADSNLSQGFSSFNPFEGIQDLKISKSAGFLKTFQNFLQRFIRFEYQSAEDAVNAMVGQGSMSRGQGVTLLSATVGRMALYTYISAALSDLFEEYVLDPAFNFVSQKLTGRDVFGSSEDDIDEGDAKYRMRRSVIGAIVQLTLGRRLGAWGKVPINFGVEVINSIYGKDLGLRGTDEYKAYQMSLMFSQLKLPNIVSIDSTEDFSDTKRAGVFEVPGTDKKVKIKEFNTFKHILDVAVGFGGPYSPVIKNMVTIVSDMSRKAGLDKDLKWLRDVNYYKEVATMEMIPWYTASVIATSLVPIPAPRDFKNVFNSTKAAINFGPDIKDPVYQKAKQFGATETDIENGLLRIQEIREEQYASVIEDLDKYLETDFQDDIKKYISNAEPPESINYDGVEHTYNEEEGAWTYPNPNSKKGYSKVAKQEKIDMLESMEKNYNYEEVWKRFMVDLHKKTAFMHIEPEEVTLGSFRFVPKGKGSKLEQYHNRPMEFFEQLDVIDIGKEYFY